MASDSEQYERMQAAYTEVGRDFQRQRSDRVGAPQAPAMEVVPQRWTILPGPEKSLISCGSFGIVTTPVE